MSFLMVFLPKGIHRSTQRLPKSIKSRVKMVSRIRLVSLWLPDPSQKGSRDPKGIQKWSDIDDVVIDFLWNFSDRLLWKCSFLAVAELCFDMYSCLLCSSAVHCVVIISVFFLACELSCLAPYPFVSRESGVYIARRFPVPLPLQVSIFVILTN